MYYTFGKAHFKLKGAKKIFSTVLRFAPTIRSRNLRELIFSFVCVQSLSLLLFLSVCLIIGIALFFTFVFNRSPPSPLISFMSAVRLSFDGAGGDDDGDGLLVASRRRHEKLCRVQSFGDCVFCTLFRRAYLI